MKDPAIGANVQLCGHKGYFVADIIRVGNVYVVNASAPVSPATLIRDNRLGPTTHIVTDFEPCFWSPQKGVFVVPKTQLREL